MTINEDFFSRDLSAEDVNLSKTGRCSFYGKEFVIMSDPEFHYELHQLYKMDRVAIIYCKTGSAKGEVNLMPYHLTPGGVLVILSNHIIEAQEVSEDFSGTHMFVSGKFLKHLDIGDSYKFHDAVDKNPYFQLDERSCLAVENYFEMCHSILEYKGENPNTEEALRLLTRLLFLMMGWFLHREVYDERITDRSSAITTKFVNLVKRNYAEHRDVDFYAERMHMTAKYLSAVITKSTGKTPIKWIENFVILDAKAQLGSTRKTIQQIAFNLHFTSQSFFGHYFKRATGISPTEYRIKVRKHEQ